MSIMRASERAAPVWGVLGLAARNRQILTYEMLGRLIGVPARGLGHLLEPIQSYCLINSLPPLTILVVQESTGLPGSGFNAATAEEYARKQLEVFEFDWMKHGAPTPDVLEKASSEYPSRRTNFPLKHTEAHLPFDEEKEYQTLGKNPTIFRARKSRGGITFFTGRERRTKVHLSNAEIESCLAHFEKMSWFPLGNTIDALKPNGLGEYFKKVLRKSPKFASHFAAVLHSQGRLLCKYGPNNAVDLRVASGRDK